MIKAPPCAPRHRYLLGGLALVGLMLAYLLVWWNRGFAGNSAGYMQLAGHAILSGKVPYRDFFLFVPPMHAFTFAALIGTFGDAFLVGRAYGATERVLVILLVYFWLARLFRPGPAFLGAFLAGVACCGDIAETLARYDFDALLWGISAGILASFSLARPPLPPWLTAACGFCAGMSILCKQTTGAGLLPMFPVIFFFGARQETISRRLTAILSYLAGWAVPVGLVCAWFYREGALGDMLNQVLLKGTSAKGSFGSILFRPLIATATQLTFTAAFLLGMAILAVFVWAIRWGARREEFRASEKQWIYWLVPAAALSIGMLLGLVPALQAEAAHEEKLFLIISAAFIFIALIGNGLMGAVYTWRALSGHLTPRDVQLWLFSSFSFVIAYMFSLSWVAYESMLVPGLAFLVAFAAHTLWPRSNRLYWRLALATCAFFLVCAGWRKMLVPYSWENWTDPPIVIETERSSLPLLRGYRLAPQTVRFMERVTKLIQTHSRPGEPIYIYPNLTFFHVLADRPASTFSFAHWFDITPDYIAQRDSRQLLAHPPAVILFVELPESYVRRHERNFRNGKSSAQREIMAAISTLRERYQLVETIEIPYTDIPLKLYARDYSTR